jgi:hypothetical protein
MKTTNPENAEDHDVQSNFCESLNLSDPPKNKGKLRDLYNHLVTISTCRDMIPHLYSGFPSPEVMIRLIKAEKVFKNFFKDNKVSNYIRDYISNLNFPNQFDIEESDLTFLKDALKGDYIQRNSFFKSMANLTKKLRYKSKLNEEQQNLLDKYSRIKREVYQSSSKLQDMTAEDYQRLEESALARVSDDPEVREEARRLDATEIENRIQHNRNPIVQKGRDLNIMTDTGLLYHDPSCVPFSWIEDDTTDNFPRECIPSRETNY